MPSSQNENNPERVKFKWYWVSLVDTDFETGLEERRWFPAMYDPNCAGGWTNGDCWEDYSREIDRWVPLPDPPEGV